MDNVRISWLDKGDKKYLKFVFEGGLTDDLARDAIKKWKKEFQILSSEDRIDLIWDCLEMKKYTSTHPKCGKMLWAN